MEDAVVSAATGALGPVLGKLAALLQAEYMRLRSIHNEIHNLTDELKAIDAFLKDMADVEDPTEQDKVWVQWVRDLSYDIEDNLDVADKSAKPDGFMDKIKSPLKRIKARREIAKAIEDLKKKVIEVSERNKRYRDHAVPNTGNASLKVDPRAHTIFKDASELVGVDGPKRELIQLLADSDSTKHQPALVSVVGFGGLGKTTIANQVYQELKGQFDCLVLFSVSRNPDITRVMSNMYGQLNKEYSPGNEDLQTLVRKILDFLEDKRSWRVSSRTCAWSPLMGAVASACSSSATSCRWSRSTPLTGHRTPTDHRGSAWVRGRLPTSMLLETKKLKFVLLSLFSCMVLP